MHCPFCNDGNTRVIDSRTTREGRVVRRRRQCEHCEKRFTTYEKIEALLPLVVKKDRRREPFFRDKITQGIRQACHKRPISSEQIEQIADDLEGRIMERGDKEIESRIIGEAVMNQLRNLDQVAYVRFASVYRKFRDLQEFMSEVKLLLAELEEPE